VLKKAHHYSVTWVTWIWTRLPCLLYRKSWIIEVLPPYVWGNCCFCFVSLRQEDLCPRFCVSTVIRIFSNLLAYNFMITIAPWIWFPETIY